MYRRSDSISFSDYTKFYDAINEVGSATAASDEFVFHCKAPFASIRSKIYRLFGIIDLNIFEILPTANIDIRYELSMDFFELGCAMEGSLSLQIENYEDTVIGPHHLYVSPPSGSQGNVRWYGGRPLKTISFFTPYATGEVMNNILGETGKKLWEEASEGGKVTRKKLYPVMSPPPGIMNLFFHIAGCNYPNRTKRMFFENIFREILLRIIAYKLPDDDTAANMDEFETEQIRNVPRILMERLDSPPSITELAHELSMSTTKLKRGFKKIFGKPIYAYHYGMCLERAAVMLLDTKRSIFEIAMEIGYSSNGNFSNAFKRHYGISPSAYRLRGGCIDRLG
jgi:AraC-like DNA-binding protein